jgi:hypothetical protein
MGIGTLLTGKVKCDWCGNYIKSADVSKVMGPGAAGLDMFSRLGSMAGKHFCSTQCKTAYEQSKGNGGGGDESEKQSGKEELKLEKERMKLEEKKAQKAMFAEVLKNGLAEEAAEEAAEKAKLEDISTMKFDGSADDISTELSNLFTLYKQQPSGFLNSTATTKKTKAAIIDKLEFGIMKLRKLDPDNADFFQKKFDELSKKK